MRGRGRHNKREGGLVEIKTEGEGDIMRGGIGRDKERGGGRHNEREDW